MEMLPQALHHSSSNPAAQRTAACGQPSVGLGAGSMATGAWWRRGWRRAGEKEGLQPRRRCAVVLCCVCCCGRVVCSAHGRAGRLRMRIAQAMCHLVSVARSCKAASCGRGSNGRAATLSGGERGIREPGGPLAHCTTHVARRHRRGCDADDSADCWRGGWALLAAQGGVVSCRDVLRSLCSPSPSAPLLLPLPPPLPFPPPKLYRLWVTRPRTRSLSLARLPVLPRASMVRDG